MNFNQNLPPDNGNRQSPGCDPKSKRNSGLFAFFKWFKPSSSRESIDTDLQNSSGSCDSLNSTHSAGTVASFSYVPPSAYHNRVTEKCIILGPETDTYKARLKQRDKRRENDKNLTLRKKYNLFFNRDTLVKAPLKQEEEENTRSLPLMTRPVMETPEEKVHRRTNSESSKMKKAGAYLHVKGKRRAPQPPVKTTEATMSLRRKKRLAPAPPTSVKVEKIITSLSQVDKLAIEYADADIIFNDSLKLEHGVLKSTKEADVKTPNAPKSPNQARSSYMEVAPVSPRPWYKRNNTTRKESKSENKYEPIERVSEVFLRNSTDLNNEEVPRNEKRKDDKRKSGLSFLTNISELDREASEIVKKEHQKNGNEKMPQFMRPKEEPIKINTDSWASPKRRSARDLIAKFNAITNVTKVTVNSAFFGPSKDMKRDYFGKQKSLIEEKKQENLLESHKKRIEQIDRKMKLENKFNSPLMKSESASAIKPEAQKIDKKSWNCPKCSIENDYWRIICHVCSTIKPYFDDFTPSTPKIKEVGQFFETPLKEKSPEKLILERSRTQIGFSALAGRKLQDKTSAEDIKKDEKERLKKMLIEMKNSLPKRKSNMLMKQNSRSSIIVENPENADNEIYGPVEKTESRNNEIEKKEEAKPNEKTKESEKTQEEKVAEILIGTKTTIYENIKVKLPDLPKVKVSTSAQTSSVLKKVPTKVKAKKTDFELMRPKDFENIYSDTNFSSPARIYANLAQNDELSLFFNVPKTLNDLKNNISHANILQNNTDTIEINRLLRKLESSIAKGDLVDAAIYAKELAQLKVNCSVIRQKAQPVKKQGYNIEMYVEDKLSHRGPFNIEVTEKQTVAELKQQVEQEFEIPINVQRWILGKELAVDDNATLKDHNICTEGCPVFLYLVAPDPKAKIPKNFNGPSTSKSAPEQTEIRAVTKDKEKENHSPKIVKVIPKVVEMTPKPEVSLKLEVKNVEAKLALEEDFDDYDTKTLKPEPKEWACHLCTLLNPVSSNICAVCATVRQKDNQKKSAKKKAPQPVKIGEASGSKDQTYQQLVNLDNTDLVESVEPFECLVCFLEVPKGKGVTLRECLHQFCKVCLAQTVEHTEDAEVKCPYRDDEYSCNIALQDREIKALVSHVVYEQYLAKSVAQAENKIGKSFHCKTPDCKGWCIFEDNVNEFRCPVCLKLNCLTCQAIHTGMNCKQYQEKMNKESEVDEDAKRTKEMLEEMVSKGEALTCPTCQVILMKKWGCDWLRCSMCKTEICWVTRGPRWGPAGKGDTTGGCQCGLNGVKCHPQCNYCH